MTCIVGIVHDGGVTISGDSAGVSALDLRTRADAKVWTRDGFAFGCTTSFRMTQILRYRLDPPRRHPETGVMQYMTTAFVDAIREALKQGGWARRENEAETGGDFMVGTAGRLFMVHADYQVAEAIDGFDACGCGAAYALGALHATPDDPVPIRMLRAMQAAERFSAGVRGPFVTVRAGFADDRAGVGSD